MEASATVDMGCGVFGELRELEPSSIHRFVLGEDEAPRKLSADDAAAELGDPFATLLLIPGTFPRTAIETLEALDQVTAEDDPLRQQMSFIVGEASQEPDPSISARGLRLLVTRGGSREDGPDIAISVFSPEQADGVELMAWDRASGGFNYYRTSGSEGAWVFAGNSLHAVLEGTEGNGPFESHPSGNIVMKELKTPWINWDSPAAHIFASAFQEEDPRREHPWFVNKEGNGAITLEAAVARPSIKRWTRARFDRIAAANGVVERPARILEQILTTRTANLVSSHIEQSVASANPIDLPSTFFVDQDALVILGLPLPPTFFVSGAIYSAAVESFGVHMDDSASFNRPGDTHFCFLVPERASEDIEVVRAARDIGLVSDRLAACLLMVDFPNPVFSARREALMTHVPEQATITNGASTFSEEMANAIVASPEALVEGSPQSEFAGHWGAEDAWRERFATLLSAYYEAVQKKLSDQAAFDDYFRLAESRRALFRKFPIGREFPLLFAQSDVLFEDRAMQADGTVVTRS